MNTGNEQFTTNAEAYCAVELRSQEKYAQSNAETQSTASQWKSTPNAATPNIVNAINRLQTYDWELL